ncbi:MAG: hypothetical protein ABR583_01200 [Gaiellaceae bacterium]
MIVVALALVVALVGVLAPAQAAFEGDNGKIVFTSDREEGDREIYVMNADGTEQKPLTDKEGDDSLAVWDPAGSRIAFVSTRDGNAEIYSMNADGSDQKPLSSHGAFDSEPAWDRFGFRIAFETHRDGNREIYLMGSQGDDPSTDQDDATNLTKDPAAFDADPAWSPKASEIAFASNTDGDFDIYLMDSSGFVFRQLTDDPAFDGHPAWSPDGSQIAFESERSGSRDIWVANADGSGTPRRLTESGNFDGEPAWSPDGQKIAYMAERGDNFNVFVTNADGSGTHVGVTEDGAFDGEPDWQPVVLDLRALEVNQAVQDWRNSIQLVAGKPATVRAFVVRKPGISLPLGPTGQLHGRRAGVPLAGSPLAPVNGPLGLFGPNTGPQRGNLGGSLNFELPAEWLSGTIELEFAAERGGAAMDCAEPVSGTGVNATRDCKVSVTFRRALEPAIAWYSVSYKEAGTVVAPTLAEIVEQILRVRSLFPLPSTRNELRSLGPYGSKPSPAKVNSSLFFLKYLECRNYPLCPSRNTALYGVMAGQPPGDTAGLANGIPGTLASGFIQGAGAPGATGGARHIAGHELGHVYGRHHAVDGSLPLTARGYKQGRCNEVASRSAPNFPFIADVGPPGGPVLRPVLGPLTSGVDNEVWGLDNRFVWPGLFNNLAVVNPRQTFELMSYCSTGGQGLWISRFTYEGLLGSFAQSTAAAAVAAAAAADPVDVLLVRGTIDLAADAATIEPVVRSETAPPESSTGSYRVRLVGPGGAVLARADFEPLVFDETVDHDGPPTGVFVVPLRRPLARVARIEVFHDGRKIGSAVGSPNAPSVRITRPAAGQSLQGGEVTFEWTASDADGDALAYTVLYSPDDGQSWETLAVDHTTTSLTVKRRDLTASQAARLRVLVSDGVNAASAVSGRFAVANNPPFVTMDRPTDADRPYSGTQNIVLRAFALDSDDGDLSGDALNWSSNRDGVLGRGESLVVNASELSEGTHVITVTAIDRAGASARDSARIQVFRDAVFFADDFETGNLVRWTTTQGLVVQTQIVDAGRFAARGRANYTPAFAFARLDTSYAELSFQIRFNLLARGPGSFVTLLRLRAADGEPLLVLWITKRGVVAYRTDEDGGVPRFSARQVEPGRWHTLRVRIRMGEGPDNVGVNYDGGRVLALTRPDELGSAPIGILQIGDERGRQRYDVVWDDVRAFTGAEPAPTAADIAGEGDG